MAVWKVPEPALAKAFGIDYPGPGQRDGTYHAFEVSERVPQVSDIIVQVRGPNSIANVMEFNDIRGVGARGRAMHCDIIVEALAGEDFVVTIGGNVGDSVRRRRFPLDANRRLVVDREQLYTQDTDSGELPDLPDTSAAAGLHTCGSRLPNTTVLWPKPRSWRRAWALMLRKVIISPFSKPTP